MERRSPFHPCLVSSSEARQPRASPISSSVPEQPRTVRRCSCDFLCQQSHAATDGTRDAIHQSDHSAIGATRPSRRLVDAFLFLGPPQPRAPLKMCSLWDALDQQTLRGLRFQQDPFPDRTGTSTCRARMRDRPYRRRAGIVKYKSSALI